MTAFIPCASRGANRQPRGTAKTTRRPSCISHRATATQCDREGSLVSRWSEDLIAVDRARTLDGLFVQRIARSPDRVAYRYFDKGAGWRQLTWREMGDWVARWRAALADEPLGAGDFLARAGDRAALHGRPR